MIEKRLNKIKFKSAHTERVYSLCFFLAFLFYKNHSLYLCVTEYEMF